MVAVLDAFLKVVHKLMTYEKSRYEGVLGDVRNSFGPTIERVSGKGVHLFAGIPRGW